MKPTRLLLVPLGLLACIALVWAKEEGKNPHWLSKKEIAALVATEPPPPSAGSDAEKADMQTEIEAEKTRTPERIAEAKLDAGYSVTLFTNIVGPKLTPQTAPVTFHFFDEVNRQIGEIVRDSKAHWKRPRPYQSHPDLIHPLFQAGDYSYPSGHSTHSYAFALVLGQVFPDRADAFMERARKIAQSRVDAGVHYTTDIREGEVLGHEIVKDLMANPRFQAALQAAKDEVAAQK